ncbi:MAG: MFS transporter [Proteobacteria bacterium]|nr:MFS transporter [Pseudomonadota bacterium]MBI3497300.1 MFS transporter [Pseudomonadota bacterium]
MDAASVVSRSGGDNLGRDVRVVAVVSAAHFFSHFFQFIVPSLFLAIQASYGVSFAELGLVMTIFYLCSGTGQTAAGFLVDRIGPPLVLAAGLGLLVVSVAAMALVPEFWLMFPMAALAGFGNSVFHPADYSIMSQRVTSSRIGRAFAIHALFGTLGYAAVPVVMVALIQFMSWQRAMLVGVLAGALVWLLVLSQVRFLAGAETRPKAKAAAAADASPFAVFRSAAVFVCFSYFLLMAAPQVGMTSFLSATLNRLFQTPIEAVAAALTLYLAGSGFGTLMGGFLADWTRHHERVVILGVACGTVIFFAVGMIAFDAPALAVVLALAGLSTGATNAARDMLVRSVATSTTTGKVFGFVYSGYDLGAALAPPILGFLLDRGLDAWVMPAVAFSTILAILSALALAWQCQSPAPAAAPAASIPR